MPPRAPASLVDLPPPPCTVPPHLRGALLLNWAVMIGAFFFDIGLIFALGLGTHTGQVGTCVLAVHSQEAPGWLEGTNETHYSQRLVAAAADPGAHPLHGRASDWLTGASRG